MEDNKHIRYFSEALQKGKLSHAYIIEGLLEKDTEDFADRISRALLCDRMPQMMQGGRGRLQACGTCPSCIKAGSGNHPDIIHVTHEKDTVLSVGEIREQVVADIAIKPFYGPYKIYIIPQARLMNENAQNALLKTIEEPQEYALIFLLTDNAQGFLPTIQSRCIRIRLADPSREDMAGRLLDEEGTRALEIIRRVSSMTAVDITKASKELEPMDRQRFLQVFQFWIRDLLVMKCTGDSGRLYYPAFQEELRTLSESVQYEDLNRMMESFEDLENRLRAKVRTDTACEAFLLRIRHCGGSL